MKNTIRNLTLVLVVALCAVCMGVFASACGESKQTEFTVTVLYSDGTAVDGTKDALRVQICSADLKFCFSELPTVDAEGKVSFNIDSLENAAKAVEAQTTFVLHVLDSDNNILKLESEVTVDRTNPTATIKLADKAAA